MHKKLSAAIWLLVCIITFYSPPEVFAKEDILQFINGLSSKIHSIKTYHSILNTMVYPSCISMEDLNQKNKIAKHNSVRSNTIVIGESGKKMNIKTVFETQESDIKIKYNLIYDGKWLWIEHHAGKALKNSSNEQKVSSMKIHIPDVSPNIEKEPFNTFFLVNGNGLSPYEDLPGTFIKIHNSYNFNKISRSESNGEIILTGTHKNCGSDNLNDKLLNQDIKSDICDDEMYCHLKVLKDSYLITAISYGNSENSICMNTEIEYVSINSKLPKNIFIYQSPQGVTIRDITSYILDKRQKEDKTGSNR